MKEGPRYVGIGCQLLGAVLLLNAGQGITGFVVAESVSVSLSGVLGLTFLLGGLGLTLWSHRTYDTYEPHVRRAIGDARYEALPDSAQQGALKAYRRHENKLEKTAQYHTRQEIKAETLIQLELVRAEKKRIKNRVVRNKMFEDAIQNHPLEPIERAITKIEEGRANMDRERMTKGLLKGLYRAKVTDTARIIYRVPAPGRVELLDYSSDHDYNETARKLGKD